MEPPWGYPDRARGGTVNAHWKWRQRHVPTDPPREAHGSTIPGLCKLQTNITGALWQRGGDSSGSLFSRSLSSTLSGTAGLSRAGGATTTRAKCRGGPRLPGPGVGLFRSQLGRMMASALVDVLILSPHRCLRTDVWLGGGCLDRPRRYWAAFCYVIVV